jgi:hypothetical protein
MVEEEPQKTIEARGDPAMNKFALFTTIKLFDLSAVSGSSAGRCSVVTDPEREREVLPCRLERRRDPDATAATAKPKTGATNP